MKKLIKTLALTLLLTTTVHAVQFDRYNEPEAPTIEKPIPYEFFVENKEEIRFKAQEILSTVVDISGVPNNVNRWIVYGFNKNWKRSIIYVYIHQK